MKFIVTKELGRLAKWLRILGFDTLYFKEDNRSRLIITALRDNRIILTRNLRLGHPQGTKLFVIKKDLVKEQLKQVLKDLKIKPDEDKLFSRCIICNEVLQSIEKDKVKDKVPKYVYETQEEFVCCLQCQRVYWAGTHWGNVEKVLKEISL